MEHSSRHLKFKLQSLSRRLDDLEEATKNLQKAEDEVFDLQDKIIQAEGSNSSMLAEVEGLRKRVMKIEGKDEEVKKAEDLCRMIKEKLENEENITRELRLEIEQLQKRMSELEKLEEAFNKSKSDCSQLGLSLNEEKNMSKKLSSELELLRTRLRELESSENRLDEAEQLLTRELENIKTLTLSFANERKRLLEQEKQNEKLILELKEKLEVQEKITGEQTRNESNLLERSSDQHERERNSLRIEDTLTSRTSQRVGLDYIKQSEIQTSSKNEKNKHQEDNKIKELNQEIEKLKNHLKHFEELEEELKQVKEKNCELQENLISEKNKNKQVIEELETLKRQTNQFREVENGVLDSDDVSHNQIKNDKTKNKVASTDLPTSKYSSRDLSPQQPRSERSRNTESHYKRQLSNSSSNSRKPSRSPLNDNAIGNLRRQEDKTSLSSYSSGKDFGSVQSDLKKSKDQPSVLSRYPPAVQEQTTHKSWKASAGKQTDRSITSFGEDYSSKANSKKEIFLENVDTKDRPTDSSEKTISANLHEETVSVENCLVSATPSSEFVNHSPDVSNAKENGNVILENTPKTHRNSEEIEVKLTSRDRLSKYSTPTGGDDNLANNNEQNESKQRAYLSHKEDLDSPSNQTSSTQRSYYARDKTRSRSTKPVIPEKPILESLDYRDTDRRARLSGLHTKRHSRVSKERIQENIRASSFENHSPSFQGEEVKESFRKTSSSDGVESTETSFHTATRTRSCSPRESLQSTMVIKPIIIEKDLKESMSEYTARSSSETSRSQVNVTANKVTTSLKIYPSEPISSRTSVDEPPRERHTSTSNIRLSANDQPVLKNNISIPFEISINKDDMVFKVSNSDKTLEHKEISKAVDHKLEKGQTRRFLNDPESEAVTWKSHNRFDTNHVDSKRDGVRSSWRKGVYGSTEELDRIDRDFSDSKSRRKSCFDEEKPARLRNHELYSRNKTSSLSSWSATPEYISKRSQSTLSATEIVSRINTSNDSLSSGYASWSRSSVEVDDSFGSRRKYTSDRLSKTDTAGWRQAPNPRQKGMVEERIRQLEH